MIEIPYLQTPEERARDKDKLKFKRSGPYPITEKLSPHAYRVQLPSSIRAHNVFNIAALTPYRANTFDGRVPQALAPETQADGSDEWQVDKILAHRNVGRGRQYLTVWKGERDIDATWEPRRNYMDSGHVTNTVLQKYEQEHDIV